MVRRHLPQILIIIVFLFIAGCVSSEKGGGFPFFGKKTEAPPPGTMVAQPMMPPQVMPVQQIQVQPVGAGPNAPPSGEIIGQPYTPPLSQSHPASSTVHSPSPSPYPSYSSASPSSPYPPASSTYGSGTPGATASPTSTYPSSGSGYVSPTSPSNSYGYPTENGSSSSGGYGPSTSIEAPVNRHYAARVQTYSPSSVSNSNGYHQDTPYYQPPAVNYQNEIPVTQVTAKTADQHTLLKGGILSVHASSTPEFLIQNGIYSCAGHEQVTIQPKKVNYESQADELPPMSGEMTKNKETLTATSNLDSKWGDEERYKSPSMWEAMASQNINAIIGNGESLYLAEDMHRYAKPLTTSDYQMAVVRGQSPKKENSPVLMTRASAIISGTIY